MWNKLSSNKLLIFKITTFFLLTFFFFLKGVIFLDPDLGWHLRYGQIILKSGIPASDPFSYTMPSYNYANHEWLTDVALTLLYSLGDLTLLSLLLAILTTLTIFLSLPKLDKIWQWGSVFLSSTILLAYSGIRPQTISWLLIIVVLKIIKSKHSLFLLPFIFLVWANVHAGFIMGLLILLIFTFSKFISEKKIPFREFNIFILSVLITLVNPYQFKLWQEIWFSVSDPELRRIITEWYPTFFSPNPLTILWLTSCVFLLVKYKAHLSLFEKFLYLILFLMGLSSSRNVPFFILATIPFIITFSEKYYSQLKKRMPDILYKRIPMSIFFLFLTVFLLSVSQMFTPSQIKSFNYPTNAISFLKKHTFKGEVFASYNWGGYLIWQYPQKRVFIDGRMPSWRQNVRLAESQSALAEYLNILTQPAESVEKTFNKYHIKLVLWHKATKKKSDFFDRLLFRWQDLVIIRYPDEKFIKHLENSGWKKIYSDDQSVIYER